MSLFEEVMKAFKDYRESIFKRFESFGGFYDGKHEESAAGIEMNLGGVDELGQVVSDSASGVDELGSILSDLSAAVDELGTQVSALSENKEEK